MRSLVFCSLLAACATAPAPRAAPPVPPAPVAKAAPAPKPARSVLDVAADAIPDGWMRLQGGPLSEGETSSVELGHFPETGFIRASVIENCAHEVANAEALARDIAAKGGTVSPVDRLNGDGRHAAFGAIVERNGVRETHRFLFEPAGRSTVLVIGIWPTASDASMRKDFDAISRNLALGPAD